jgi:hypothetical protein
MEDLGLDALGIGIAAVTVVLRSKRTDESAES